MTSSAQVGGTSTAAEDTALFRPTQSGSTEGSGRSVRSDRRRGEGRGKVPDSASRAPPPPTIPPPHLARRSAQREAEPMGRAKSSSDEHSGEMHSGMKKQANAGGRGPRVLVVPTPTHGVGRSGGSRGAFLVPPPTDSPPSSAASSHGRIGSRRGVLRQRRSNAPTRGSCDDRRSGFGSTYGRQHRGRRIDSNGSRRSSSSSFSSNDRSRHDRSINTCGGSSGSEDGKTYITIDDLVSEDGGAERRRNTRSGGRTSTDEKEPQIRDGRQAIGRRIGNDGDSRCRYSPSSQASNSCDSRKNTTSDGWTNRSGVEHDEITHGEEGNRSEDDESQESSVLRTNGAQLPKKRADNARGSETTATPSPRDHPHGYSGSAAGDTFVDGVSEGVMGWPAGSTAAAAAAAATDTESCRTRRSDRGGGHNRSERPSTISSSTLTPNHESRHSPQFDRLNSDNCTYGTEAEDSATERSRRSGDEGYADDTLENRRTSSSRRKKYLSATRCHQSTGSKERSVMDEKHSRSASKAGMRRQARRSLGQGHGVARQEGKPTRRNDTMGSDRGRRHHKALPRRDSSSAHGKGGLADNVAARDVSSSIARDDDDDDDNSAARRRTENSSTATAEGEEDSQGTAVIRDMTSGMKPRTAAGAWFAAQEEKKAREGSKRDGNGGESGGERDGVDAAASDDSFSDNIVSSKRRYCGKGEGMATGRCGGDETSEEDGGRGKDPWASIIEGGRSPARCNSLMLSYERGNNSDMVQCVVVRDRSGMNRLYPQYRFFFEGRGDQLMMVAQKCSKNRTSNYHVFDMNRGGFQTRLSKKNGNYLGKVRTNLKRTEATVFTNDQAIAELGAISFEKPGLVDHLRDGSQPRKFTVLLPALDCDGSPVAHKVDPYDADSDMLSRMKQGRHGNMFLLQSREPTYTKGNYRLNFHGRVTVPSVKNFQLVSPDDTLHTVCQFGKVGEDRFHLDYRAPINAFQALCISIAQFNF
ncbi:unnamed protein product [Ectocarpus sp. 12 AP-2014]